MSEDPMTEPTCWAVDIDDGLGPLLCSDSEAEAVETQQIAEYEQGSVAIVFRG